MVKFTFGQKLWDAKNCREIEIRSFNGVGYWCKVEDYGGYENFVYPQYFTAKELINIKGQKQGGKT